MATRGQIAYLADSNTIFSIYIHYASDSNLNEVLPEYFNSDSEAEDLVMNGNDIRFIDSENGEVERYDKGGAIQITNNEPEELFNELYSHANSKGADYVYIWLNDKWVTLKMSEGRQYFVNTLLDQTMETNSYYVTNEEADEDARMNEDYQKRLWQHRAGIIK